MTNDNPNGPSPENEVELHRLREHNKQLLAELKTARTEAKTLQEAAEAATARANEWKARWYAEAIEKPLEADLRCVAAGPWKYLRDTCVEAGLLIMEPDGEGIERPIWRDAKGEPADLAPGLWKFLESQCGAIPDLAHALRTSGAAGGGAWNSQHGKPASTEPETPKPVPAPPVSFGLR